MRRSPKLRPCRWDVLPAALAVLLAAGTGLGLWNQGGEPEELSVVVSVNGEEVDRFALSELPDGQGPAYSNNGYTLRIAASHSIFPDQLCVQVVSSDCPTQDCVHTGEIHRPGQSIVCLPARIVIQLEGGTGQSSDVDAVVG